MQNETFYATFRLYISYMTGISDGILYVLIFLALYVQVFFLLTFFENKKVALKRTKDLTLKRYPSLTVIVPVWNEEETLVETVDSLLELDYPKDKLKIIIVDDGSSDSSWEKMQNYLNHERVDIYSKENGGKHSAVNLGILKSDTEFITCLDADSYVKKDGLLHIFKHFEENPQYQAVIPAALIHKSDTFVRKAQNVEYTMAVLFKKIFAILGGLHVTPGTLPVYRREVFDRIGEFKKAYNGEDMEMAFRMQLHHLPIGQCSEAVVYTTPPATISKLFKQRLRWIFAYINNIIDYRFMFFRKKYGHFSMFTIPAGIVGILTVVYMFWVSLFYFIRSIFRFIERVSISGFDFGFSLDWFTISINTLVITALLLYVLVFSMIRLGNRMSDGKRQLTFGHVIGFLVFFAVFAPLWLTKSIQQTLTNRHRKLTWR